MKLIYSLVCFCLLGVVVSAPSPLDLQHRRAVEEGGTYIPVTAPYANIFAQLSEEDDESVRMFLEREKNTTNLGNFTKIWAVNALNPKKTAAIAYLDGRESKPARFAQATLRFECYLQEWMIGPLPISNSTKAVPMDYLPSKGKLHFPDCVQREPFEGLTSPEEDLGWNREQLPHDDKAAPIAVLPDGARYEYDPKQNYISWMDFTFLVATGRTGVALYDIRFEGERIAYELVLQEAIAHYAGVEQLASETAYLDTMLMWEPGKLVPGFDCPSYATYTDAFCMFEYPKDFPLQRHTEGYYHVTKNIAFIVRSVVTIGNYDYQLNFEFGVDGSIQVLARASGYIAWAPWNDVPEDPMFGMKVRDGWSGAMHDHVLNFKLDLDVNGTANSLYKTEFKPYSQVFPWSNGTIINTMKVDRSFIATEAKIDWASNPAATYAVVNRDSPNHYGEFPGYKIYPSTGASISLTVQDSTTLGNAANWATHPLYAVKRKDSEPSAAYEWNYYNVKDPLVDFNSFVNGESLEQEDVVIYFNLGMHHLPDTFDMPNTMFTGAQSGITIRPQNYGLSNPSLATRQMVRIAEDGKSVDYYGQKMPSGTLNLDATNPDLVGF